MADAGMVDGGSAGLLRLAARGGREVRCRQRRWLVADNPVVAHAVAEFTGGFELRTLEFFDATLLKIDIEGAEYEVIPALAGLLGRHRPFLHVSFHPFNLVVPGDVVATALLRLRRMIDAVEALRVYGFWYVPLEDGWREVTPPAMADFLATYLLRAKPVARIASPQYGPVDGIGFSRERLDLPGCRGW